MPHVENERHSERDDKRRGGAIVCPDGVQCHHKGKAGPEKRAHFERSWTTLRALVEQQEGKRFHDHPTHEQQEKCGSAQKIEKAHDVLAGGGR